MAEVSNKWYLPRKFHKLKESPSLRRLYTSDSDIGSSTVELQAQLDKAMAVEQELREQLAIRPIKEKALESRIEERDRRIALLEKEAKDTRLGIKIRDIKMNQLMFCIVILGALVVDLGIVMFKTLFNVLQQLLLETGFTHPRVSNSFWKVPSDVWQGSFTLRPMTT